MLGAKANPGAGDAGRGQKSHSGRNVPAINNQAALHTQVLCARHDRDRAAVVATAILHVVWKALGAWLDREDVDMADTRARIKAILRDEFADVARMTLSEIRESE